MSRKDGPATAGVVSVWDIRAQHGENRYGAFVDDELVGHAACFRVGDALAVPHVQVQAAFRNLGIGSDLARSICRDACAQGLRVVALCPFMRCWGQAHPQYQEVLRAAWPGEPTAVALFVGAADLQEEKRLPAEIDRLTDR